MNEKFTGSTGLGVPVGSIQPSSILEDIQNAVIDCHVKMTSINMQLRTTADNLFEPEPRSDSETGATVGEGQISKLQSAVERLQGVIQEADRQVRRFSNLA